MAAILVLYLFCVICSSGASRILLVPGQIKSHLNYFYSVGNALALAGHEVYSTSHNLIPNANDVSSSKIQLIQFNVPADSSVPGMETTNRKVFTDFFQRNITSGFAKMSQAAYDECRFMMEDQHFLNEISSLKFDLAIADGWSTAPCMPIVPHSLGIPFIVMASQLFFYDLKIPALPSFVPLGLMETTDCMTFAERLENLLNWAKMHFYMPFPGRQNTELLLKHSRDPEITNWDHLLQRAELTFFTRDLFLDKPFVLMPHVVTLGCITCHPSKALSEDLQAFADGAKDGLIVVSFGSVTHYVSESITDKLMEALSHVTMRVVWKYPGVNLPTTIPEHIKIMRWLPQNDLLGHANTRLFITHCGNNGQYESVYHGIPMIGFPVMGEQGRYAARIVHKGLGIRMDLQTFQPIDLINAINSILPKDQESAYTKTAKHLSALIKSMPQTAQEKAVYWTEHILKFGGSHLKSHAMNMPYYQLYMLDIFALLLTIFVGAASLICCFLIRLRNRICKL